LRVVEVDDNHPRLLSAGRRIDFGCLIPRCFHRGVAEAPLPFQEGLPRGRRDVLGDDRRGPRAVHLQVRAGRVRSSGFHGALPDWWHFAAVWKPPAVAKRHATDNLSESQGNSASRAKSRSALKGRLWKRIPVASAMAFPRAGATGMMGASPSGFAPRGPY